MKREVIFILLFIILFFPFATGKGICSDGNATIIDSEEIKVNDAKNINGIKIVVIDSDEISVYSRYTADVFIDGDKGKVTNSTSDEFVLSSGSYNATLISTSPGKARIKIADDEEELELDELGTINGLNALLIEVVISSNEAEGSATLLIGANKVSFSNDGNPSDILEVGGKKYLIELFSASDGEASFTVSKCESGEIQELIAQSPNNMTNTSTIANNTIDNSASNNSAEEEENSSEPQITIEEFNRRKRELELGINSRSGNASSLEVKKGKVANAGKWIFFVFIGIAVIVIAYVFIRMKLKWKNKVKN